jgi:hypothetical protein
VGIFVIATTGEMGCDMLTRLDLLGIVKFVGRGLPVMDQVSDGRRFKKRVYALTFFEKI